MRIQTILVSFFTISGLAAGCAVQDEPQPSDTQNADAERGRKPLGKADLTGSCSAITHNADGDLVQKEYCGGKSYGTCWCDASCSEYGDCCEDYEDTCTEPPSGACEAGQLECGGCCGTTFCVEDTGQVCPIPVCPAWCPEPSCVDFGGTCVSSELDVTFPPTSCGEVGRADALGSCDAINQICCGDELPAPPAAASCVDQCGGAAPDKACYCDALCEDYGDCCEDYAAACGS